MRFKVMTAVVAMAITTPSFAQTSDSASTPMADAKPKKEKKVCRPLEPLPGSNMVRSTCKTKAEWAKVDGTDDPTANDAAIPGVRSGNGVSSAGNANAR